MARLSTGCYWYHKGKTFQANHNNPIGTKFAENVVIDTTKVRLFKQITTYKEKYESTYVLLLIPQR